MALINVSNRLPVTLGKQIKKSSGGLVSALEGVTKSYDNFLWLGWSGGSGFNEDKQEQLRKKLKEEYSCIPVFLSRQEVKDYYEGFSNSSLWPVLHYMHNLMEYREEWWEAYKRVNEIFARVVLENSSPGDTVWVHDYHLMLLPSLIKRSNPELKVGFFLHTSFPSYEIFRCHPRRNELLAGVVESDLIGFHTFGYLRHFRSSAMRLLSMDTEENQLYYKGHLCQLGVYPIGVDAKRFIKTLAGREAAKKRKELTEAYKGKRVVLNVERLDYTKGLLHKLQSIEEFLASSKDRNSFVFIFIAVPSREEVKEYKLLLEQVERQVGRINGLYSTLSNTPIHFLHNSVKFEELCALYSLAEVALVTPLMDGMNLVAKEYVVCQEKGKGALDPSEFAGAAMELFNAVVVNPYDTASVAKALENAFSMPEDEKIKRMEKMRSRVLKFDSIYWADSFLKDLRKISLAKEEIPQNRDAQEALMKELSGNKDFALFLDYDGTLVDFTPQPEESYPSGELLNLLKEMKLVKGIHPYIISGRKREDLENWLRETGLPLLSEHGNSLFNPETGIWEALNFSVDLSWKEYVREILALYEGSTPGSFIEEKQYSLVWHYRKSDPEFGNWKARTLISELLEVAANLPVQVHHGKKIVEVSSIHISKGRAVEQIVNREGYQRVVCLGDDQTDETMFFQGDKRFLSVKVGKEDTRAMYRFTSPGMVLEFLRRIVQERKK